MNEEKNKSVKRIIRDEMYVQHIENLGYPFHSNKRSRASLPYSEGISDAGRAKILRRLAKEKRLEKKNETYTRRQTK